MRADSIRDLYAKGLALVGLGMLAGAGALVDYWPTRGSLPVVVLLPPRPDFTPQLRPVRTDLLAVAAALTPPSARPISVTTSDPVPAIRVSAPPVDLGQPVALPGAPPAAEPAIPVVLLASAPAVSSTPAVEFLILPPLATPVIAAAFPPDAEHGTFLTGAVKRTGASILRTSARTGASIVDAVRTVGGAFRRALPN